MQTKYLVTTELKTSWWLKILRFLKLKSQREEFILIFMYSNFKKGDIINAIDNEELLILEKYAN